MLRVGDLEEARRTVAVEKIETNARFLGRLIADLLDVSRIVSGKLSIDRAPVDVGDVVGVAVDAVRAAADAKGVVLEHWTSSAPALVSGSAERLQQVFTNLLTNAIKFSGPGQTVTVTTAAADGGVSVTVKDEGEGIEPAFLPFLFGKFSQADASNRRRHGGLGLGLSIAKHLTELHGGAIDAHSAGPRQGAEFVVQLPALVDADASPSPVQRMPTPASLVGLRVLAVDDDVEARDVVASVLLACGATVTVVGSATEMFAALRVDVPDIVLSDISMPHVDGHGLLDRLRASTDPRVAALPVVALTAIAEEDSRRRALDRGFDAYLTKPLDAVVLSHTLLEIARSKIGSRGEYGDARPG